MVLLTRLTRPPYYNNYKVLLALVYVALLFASFSSSQFSFEDSCFCLQVAMTQVGNVKTEIAEVLQGVEVTSEQHVVGQQQIS